MRRVLHDIWVVLKPVSEVLLALVILVGLVVVPTLGGENVNVKNNLNGFVTSALGGTGGANTGPLVGDQSLFDQETKCVKSWAQDPANNYVGYWPAIGAPEHADNVRSGLQPCADFTGDFNGQNQVFQYPSETTYPNGVGLVVFDGPDAGYLWAGGIVPGSGQYISKFNPSTGAEIWRTNLTNINAATDQWYALGSMALIEDGTLVGAASNWFWKLDRSTGEILAAREQPTVGTPASSQNYDGMTVAPDEQGTLLIKSQTRPAGCSNQTNNAMNSCTSEYGPNPNSDMVAVDPVTLKNLDAIEINQNVTARASTVEHDGKIYVYGNGAKSLVRVIWDPETQTLKQDLSWQPQVLLKGQSGGASPVVMGDWVIANSNAAPSTETPQCIFAANQDDPNDVHHICPWGKSFPVASGATMSEVPATPGIDPEKNLIFVGDWFLKGVYAIQLDQQTGEMKVKWSRPDWWSADYFTMVGPKDERVLISQNIDASTKTVDQPSYNYNETVLFVNEDTGETIAESASNPSTAIGSLINAGYGGRFYTMGNDGTLWIYQVQACKDASINVTPPSTTSCPPVTASSPSASASASPSG
jgi:hypothetical protein